MKSEIDTGIKPLCDLFNSSPYFRTHGSCQGHSDEGSNAYVGLQVKGMAGLRLFTRILKNVEAEFEKHSLDIMIDCWFNFSDNVLGCTDFDDAPEWIAFELKIENDGDQDALAEITSMFHAEIAPMN